MHWLATSNYEVSFGEIPLGERVLSPAGPAESRGMEDARFVRFSEEDGSTSYYATYTAFDGFEVLPNSSKPPTSPPSRSRRSPGYAPGARAWPCFPVG